MYLENLANDYRSGTEMLGATSSSPKPTADEYQEEDYNPPSANFNPVNKLKMRYINRTGDRTSYSTEVLDGKVKGVSGFLPFYYIGVCQWEMLILTLWKKN